MTAQRRFQKAADLTDRVHQVSWAKSGFWIQHFLYAETWDRKQWDSRVPIHVHVSVEVPGEIETSNADQVDSQTATWIFSSSDMGDTKVLSIRYKRWNVLAFFGPVILILVICVMIASLIKPKVLRCSSCNANVPANSAFCNSCGSKIKQ